MRFKHAPDGFIYYLDGKTWKIYSSQQVSPQIYKNFIRDKTKTKSDEMRQTEKHHTGCNFLMMMIGILMIVFMAAWAVTIVDNFLFAHKMSRYVKNMQLPEYVERKISTMTYAIEILERDKKYLEAALSTWETDHYPEARKDRDKKLKEINEAIEILKNNCPNP